MTPGATPRDRWMVNPTPARRDVFYRGMVVPPSRGAAPGVITGG
jgi:hypothetical protein